jgi:hypothetical protein
MALPAPVGSALESFTTEMPVASVIDSPCTFIMSAASAGNVPRSSTATATNAPTTKPEASVEFP